MSQKSMDAAAKKLPEKLAKLRHRILALEAGLAGRAYKLEKGKDPEKYADLVPEYLKKNAGRPGHRAGIGFFTVKVNPRLFTPRAGEPASRGR